MSELEASTISITVLSSNQIDKTEKATDVTPSNWRLIRPLSILIAITSLSLICWGTWTFLGSSRSVDKGESIADLEGFESAPPFEEPSANDGSSDARLGNSSSLAAPDEAEMLSPNSLILDSTSKILAIKSAKVWLTGTIEDAEPMETIALPERLSGGRNESLILR